MRLVVGTLAPPKDVLTALEWSINEITDNVLTHADSRAGGLVQILSLPNPAGVVFSVADAGRGVLASMREGHPNLASDSEAIGNAVRAGVTRDPRIGQGNGLAGTLRVATLSGGRFVVGSLRGRVTVTADGTQLLDARPAFHGTMVTAAIPIASELRIEEALGFTGSGVEHLNILDYHDEEGDAMVLHLERETRGVGSRPAGAFVREKCRHLLSQESRKVLVLDWTGVPVISSSFADEALGKLFVELGPLVFGARIRHRNMELVNSALVNKAILQRVAQHMAGAHPSAGDADPKDGEP